MSGKKVENKLQLEGQSGKNMIKKDGLEGELWEGGREGDSRETEKEHSWQLSRGAVKRWGES